MQTRRVSSFAISTIIHLSMIARVVFGPEAAFHPPPETRASIEKKYTVVWYPQPKIPEVSPQLDSAEKKTIPRPLPQAAKTILSTRTDAEVRKQLIWQPPPVIRLQQEIP